MSRGARHGVGKTVVDSIELVAGLGVADDVHAGVTIQHRSRVARDPAQPNLRRVHLIHSELHDELREAGFHLSAGEMGEKRDHAWRGAALAAARDAARARPERGARDHGLRNPCVQLDGIAPGLMAATLERDEHSGLVRKAGVMAVVLSGGPVSPGDRIAVELPRRAALEALKPV